MRVIGAGFARTGTLSLKHALERLGFGPCFHMFDLIRDPARIELWEDAVEDRPVDWHEVFAGYGATVDWPGCSFYEALLEAFPAAKVVLTVRDPDAWYESALRTIHAAQRAEREGVLGTAPPPPVMRVIATLIWSGTFRGRFLDREFAIRVFNEHNARVRATVAPERLLVYDVGAGWGPLVEFLGVTAPDAPFPHLNDTAAFRAMVGLP